MINPGRTELLVLDLLHSSHAFMKSDFVGPALAKVHDPHYFVQCSKAIALGGLAGDGTRFGVCRAFRAQRPERRGFDDPLFSQTFSLPDLLSRVFGPGFFVDPNQRRTTTP